MLPDNKVMYHYMAEIMVLYSSPLSTKPRYRPKHKILNKQYMKTKGRKVTENGK